MPGASTSLARLLLCVLLCGPVTSWAAGSGAAEPIVFVADSRRFSGWEAWFSNLYNESLLSFTLLTVVSIPVIGMLLGAMADLLMSRIGINLRSRSVTEH